MAKEGKRMDRTDLLLAVLLLCVGIYGAIIVFAVTAIFGLLRDIKRGLSHCQGRSE